MKRGNAYARGGGTRGWDASELKRELVVESVVITEGAAIIAPTRGVTVGSSWIGVMLGVGSPQPPANIRGPAPAGAPMPPQPVPLEQA